MLGGGYRSSAWVLVIAHVPCTRTSHSQAVLLRGPGCWFRFRSGTLSVLGRDVSTYLWCTTSEGRYELQLPFYGIHHCRHEFFFCAYRYTLYSLEGGSLMIASGGYWRSLGRPVMLSASWQFEPIWSDGASVFHLLWNISARPGLFK